MLGPQGTKGDKGDTGLGFVKCNLVPAGPGAPGLNISSTSTPILRNDENPGSLTAGFVASPDYVCVR